MALMTEAQPLMLQAQGISAGSVWLMLAKAIGNGMPIKKPSGAINIIIFSQLLANYRKPFLSLIC